jgi:hypothetical protein
MDRCLDTVEGAKRVPDVLRLAEINDFLGDVFRVVGDAFEAFGGHHPVQAAADGVGIFHHVLGEGGVDLLVERVHFLVARNDGAGGGGITFTKASSASLSMASASRPCAANRD